MPKPIPDSEDERTLEAKILLNKLFGDDLPKLTTFERQIVEEIGNGMAVTRVRLKLLRDTVERIEKENATQP